MISILFNLIKKIYAGRLKYFNFKLQKILKKNINQNFTLLDIGAANGINLRWNLISEKINQILVEPHAESAVNLRKQGHDVIETVLSDHDNKLINFYKTKKPMLSSMFEPNLSYLSQFQDVDRFSIVEKKQLKSMKLDTVFKNQKLNTPNFIKIDTEGSELEILKGANELLKKNTLFGLEVETSLFELRKKQPSIFDIKNYLKGLNFNLIDFINIIRWEKNNFRHQGQPNIIDCLFIKDEKIIINDYNNKNISDIDLLNYILILIVYERVDMLEEIICKLNLKKFSIDKVLTLLKKKSDLIETLNNNVYFIKNYH